MINIIRSRLRSFRYAFSGLYYVLKTQKNAWIHLAATILVIILGVWLRIPTFSWAVIILTIGMVWFAEIINSSLEAIVDLASPQRHPLAKVGKDVGAAAVLIAAVTAVIIGLLLIGLPLIEKIKQIGYQV